MKLKKSLQGRLKIDKINLGGIEIDYAGIKKEFNIDGRISDARKENSNLVLKIEEDSRKLQEIRIYSFFDNKDYQKP